MIGAAGRKALDEQDAQEWTRLTRRGDFEGAWAASDRIRQRHGWVCDGALPRHYQNVWNGTPLTGRRVLIRCYHGLGDTIQFIRYAPLVRSIAAHVVVWAQPRLVPLLEHVAGIDELLPLHDGAPDAEYDVDVEVMELPYVFRTTLATIPKAVPYLSAEPIRLAGKGLRVGLVWRAGEWDSQRCVPFAALVPLLDRAAVSWYSLQLAPRCDEQHTRLQSVPAATVIATARAMAALDLVISVDSMPAHLAGALGVPVWTLLPRDADWRWLEDRTDSPWYPTMCLFRQPVPGCWASVVEDIGRALDGLSGSRPCSLVRVLVDESQEVVVPGDKQLKKDGNRKDKKTKARNRDFEQPIVGAASPQRAQDASSLSGDDGEKQQSHSRANDGRKVN
jgi:hypothetical protein